MNVSVPGDLDDDCLLVAVFDVDMPTVGVVCMDVDFGMFVGRKCGSWQPRLGTALIRARRPLLK